MTKLRLLGLILAATTAVSAVSVPSAAAGTAVVATVGCYQSADAEESVTHFLTSLLSGSGATTSALRSNAGFVGLTPSDVQIVTDSTLCHRAAVASNERVAVDFRDSLTSVIVAKVGNNRYVVDGGSTFGEFAELAVFDTSFTYVMSFGY